VKHSTQVVKALQATEALQDDVLQLWLRMCEVDEGSFYPVDLVANAAVKRCLSQSHGFCILVENFNLMCARSLLRLQVDTAIRFYAVFLVESPHDFCHQIIKGTPINKMKDRDGNRLTDRYLVDKLGAEHTWIPRVYEELSGYIHFSVRHFYPTVESLNGSSREMKIVISPTDENVPEFSWLEVVDCFNEATRVFLEYLNGWVTTKARTPHPQSSSDE
jgi:hypothetical protein